MSLLCVIGSGLVVVLVVVLFSPGVILLEWLRNRCLKTKPELFSDDELRVVTASLRAATEAAISYRGLGTDSTRYTADAAELAGAGASLSAHGVRAQLGLPDELLYSKLARGVEAIEEEWRAHGSAENQRQLKHVLHEPSSASEGLTAEGELDEGRVGQPLV